MFFCVFFLKKITVSPWISFFLCIFIKWISKDFSRDIPSPTPSPPLPPFSHSIARATNARRRPCSRTALLQMHALALRCAFVRHSQCDRNTSAFAALCVDLPPSRRERWRRRRRKSGAAERDSGGVALRVMSRALLTLRLSRGLQSVRSLLLLQLQQQQSFGGGVTIKKHLFYRSCGNERPPCPHSYTGESCLLVTLWC